LLYLRNFQQIYFFKYVKRLYYYLNIKETILTQKRKAQRRKQRKNREVKKRGRKMQVYRKKKKRIKEQTHK
jgi:hypothetical protein